MGKKKLDVMAKEREVFIHGQLDENKNVVVISEQEYNELQRAKRNAEYLAKLDRSFAQLKQGEVVIKSMEELERMADE